MNVLSTQEKWAAVAIVCATCIGLFDSVYLTYTRLTGGKLSCAIFDGCNIVASSPYSEMFGIPLSALGISFYVLAMALMVLWARSIIYKQLFLNAMLVWGAMGFLFSLYFVYLQGFVIKYFCIYCLVSAATTTIYFCAALAIWGGKEKKILSEVKEIANQ